MLTHTEARRVPSAPGQPPTRPSREITAQAARGPDTEPLQPSQQPTAGASIRPAGATLGHVHPGPGGAQRLTSFGREETQGRRMSLQSWVSQLHGGAPGW